MNDNYKFRPNLDCYGIPQRGPGWIYDVQTGVFIKIGKTKIRIDACSVKRGHGRPMSHR